MRKIIPPIKTQGIKTKLIEFIFENIHINPDTLWIEPFLGSGSVAFNLAPKKAILSDINPYIIHLYDSLKRGAITPEEIASHLDKEGNELSLNGEKHYYFIRNRFNNYHDIKDFIFLNRSCFNGLMRFNKKGEFNVPFCKKNNRFRQALISKIYNQLVAVKKKISSSDWIFLCQGWDETLKHASKYSFVYLDPPYIGRYNDYFSSWSEEEANKMAVQILQMNSGYALSMWKENSFRRNKYLDQFKEKYIFRYFKHFYHLGALEKNRKKIIEALVITPTYAK